MSSSKNINPSLVLVQPRKTRPFITERFLIGCKESNQTNKVGNGDIKLVASILLPESQDYNLPVICMIADFHFFDTK